MNITNRPHEKVDRVHDAEILNDVISVCRDGRSFYRFAAQEVDDQTLRNLFQGMANIRGDLVDELEPRVESRGVSPSESGTLSGSLRLWYVNAKEKITDFGDHEFIEEVEQNERRTLGVLRTAVREVEDPKLANTLSSKIASIQMTHDRMKALNKMNRHH